MSTSVRDALKAAKEQSNSGSGDAGPAVDEKAATTAATSGSTDTAATANAQNKPSAKPRQKVNDEWFEVLRMKVNEQFADFLNESEYVEAHGEAKIDFTIANNKGNPVSLTPRIIYADGAIQSPGPKGRLGFCTDGQFDEWFKKVDEKLQLAMSRKPRVKGRSPAKQSFWSPIAEQVREKLGEKYSVRSTGGRMTIKENVPEGSEIEWPMQASFKQEDDKIILSSGKGDLDAVYKILTMVVETVAASSEESEDTTE